MTTFTKLRPEQLVSLIDDLAKHGKEHYLEDILLRNGLSPVVVDPQNEKAPDSEESGA